VAALYLIASVAPLYWPPVPAVHHAGLGAAGRLALGRMRRTRAAALVLVLILLGYPGPQRLIPGLPDGPQPATPRQRRRR